MKTSNISFGRVVALSGKDSKMKRVKEKLLSKSQPGTVIVRDVTDNYRYAPLTGSLAIAAQKGDRIDVYITGDDAKKFNKVEGWKTMDDVLSNLSAYYELAKMSISEAVDAILRG